MTRTKVNPIVGALRASTSRTGRWHDVSRSSEFCCLSSDFSLSCWDERNYPKCHLKSTVAALGIVSQAIERSEQVFRKAGHSTTEISNFLVKNFAKFFSRPVRKSSSQKSRSCPVHSKICAIQSFYSLKDILSLLSKR